MNHRYSGPAAFRVAPTLSRIGVESHRFSEVHRTAKRPVRFRLERVVARRIIEHVSRDLCFCAASAEDLQHATIYWQDSATASPPCDCIELTSAIEHFAFTSFRKIVTIVIQLLVLFHEDVNQTPQSVNTGLSDDSPPPKYAKESTCVKDTKNRKSRSYSFDHVTYHVVSGWMARHILTQSAELSG